MTRTKAILILVAVTSFLLGAISIFATHPDGDNWMAKGVWYITGRLQFGQSVTSPAVYLGGGTNTTPLSTSTADKNFADFRTKTTATSGTSRGLYWRHYLDDTTPSGETARLYTTVDTAGATDAHGAHVSLSYGSSGTCTGETAAIRSTFQVPNKTLGGTNASLYTELWADGTSSDMSNGSFQRYVLGGDGTGAAKIDASGALFSVEGVTSGAGNIFYVHAPTTLAAGLKVKINGVEYVLPLYSTE